MHDVSHYERSTYLVNRMSWCMTICLHGLNSAWQCITWGESLQTIAISLGQSHQRSILLHRHPCVILDFIYIQLRISENSRIILH